MIKRFQIASLLTVLLLGCSVPRPAAPVTPVGGDSAVAEGYGRASIQIRWPERRTVQTIPYQSMLARLVAYDASGSLLATASIRRDGSDTLGEASLDLPIGSGRYLDVSLDSEVEAGIARGRSEAFAIRRNQTVQVSVVLEPIVQTHYGPINAFSVSGGTTPFAGLGRIWSVAVGPDDTLYLADFSNHAVRAVALDGSVRVVMGQVTDTATQSQGVPSTVSPDNSGEGGPAEAATLRTPHGVYVAPNGDLYVADTLVASPLQVRIRFVPAASGERFGAQREEGHVYTLFTMASAFGAIGMLQDLDGALLFTQQNRNEIWRLTEAGTASVFIGGGSSTADGELPGSVSLFAPWGLTMDAHGNLFFSEYQAGRVRMLCRASGSNFGKGGMEAGKVYTVVDGLAFKNQFGLSNVPFTRAIAMDRRSNLLVVDNRSHAVYRADRLTGSLVKIAGGVQTSTTIPLGDGGTAASASFSAPHGIAVDSNDRLYVGDTLNGRVRRLHL